MSMSIDTVNSICVDTARLDIHEVVRRLNSHLGTTLVPALTGSKYRKLPHRWAKSDDPVPGPRCARHAILGAQSLVESAGRCRDRFFATGVALELVDIDHVEDRRTPQCLHSDRASPHRAVSSRVFPA